MKEKKGYFSKLNKILHKYAFLISPIIVSAIFALLFSINNIYPFGRYSISWCDGDQQFIPLLCDFKDVLLGKNGFFLSPSNSGGMNFYGVFFFNLSSPFTLLCLLYEKSRMAYAFNLIVVLKLVASSVTFSILLKQKTKNFALVVFPSVLYAFSGYGMMYYQIAQWLDVYYMFPLVLLGLERMVDGKDCLLYAISLFLCVLFQFYLSYAVVIFICLYAFCYVVFNRDKARRFSFSFILGSVIAALLSGVIIIPCYLQYTQSMRTSSIIQTLANSSFSPSINTTFPTYFCLASLLAFAINGLVSDNKNFRYTLFLLTCFPIFIEPIAKGWQTFNYMSFPTRYGFVVISLCIFMAVEAIEKLTCNCVQQSNNHKIKANIAEKEVKNRIIQFVKGESRLAKIIYAVLILVSSLVLFLYSIDYYSANGEPLSVFTRSLWGDSLSLKGLALFAFFTLLFGVVAFIALKFKLTYKSAVFGAIALCLITEAVFSCNVYMISSVKFRSKNNNVAVKMERVFELENIIKDDEFYRVKLNAKPFDVNMVGALGYNSLSHYTSLNGKNYMMTAKALGYSSYWMEVNSRGGTLFADALVRNKYTIKGASSGGEYTTKNNSVIKNDLLFPSIFVLQSGEYYPDYGLERHAIQNELFKNLTGESDLFIKYEPTKTENIEGGLLNGKYVYNLADGVGKTAKLEYKINVVDKCRLYFDIFDEYTNSLREPTYEKISELSVYKNGKRQLTKSKFPLQNDNGIVDLGEYENCTITVRIELSSDIIARSFGVFSMDVDKLETSINRLIGGDLKQIRNGYSCKITSPEGGYAFIPMPYESGYKAVVNGRNREIGYFGGFMTVGLDKGVNEIKFTFRPQGFSIGLILSILGAISLVLYIVFKEKIAKMADSIFGKVLLFAIIGLGFAVILVVYAFPVVVNLLA